MNEKTYGITDFGSWLLDNQDKMFRILVYKKVYTPYEQDKKFSDESIYENGGYYDHGFIVEAMEIPGDILIGVSLCNSDNSEDLGIVKYYRLSEIRLSRVE